MKVSENVKEQIKRFEGCRLTSYQCASNVWTIGYGHTGSDVYPNLEISQERAVELFEHDILIASEQVNAYNHIYHWTQNEYDALVSFVFNIGSLDQVTANGSRSKEEIANAIPKYCHSRGKALAGLVARRDYELNLFWLDVDIMNSDMHDRPTLQKGTQLKDDVKNLQESLYKIGMLNEKNIDGIYGGGTVSLIKALQYSTGLKSDGIVGRKTYAMLDYMVQADISFSDYVRGEY